MLNFSFTFFQTYLAVRLDQGPPTAGIDLVATVTAKFDPIGKEKEAVEQEYLENFQRIDTYFMIEFRKGKGRVSCLLLKTIPEVLKCRNIDPIFYK